MFRFRCSEKCNILDAIFLSVYFICIIFNKTYISKKKIHQLMRKIQTKKYFLVYQIRNIHKELFHISLFY